MNGPSPHIHTELTTGLSGSATALLGLNLESNTISEGFEHPFKRGYHHSAKVTPKWSISAYGHFPVGTLNRRYWQTEMASKMFCVRDTEKKRTFFNFLFSIAGSIRNLPPHSQLHSLEMQFRDSGRSFQTVVEIIISY
jgi:hypothetical protein